MKEKYFKRYDSTLIILLYIFPLQQPLKWFIFREYTPQIILKAS